VADHHGAELIVVDVTANVGKRSGAEVERKREAAILDEVG